MATPQALLNAGDINNLGDVAKKLRLGDLLAGTVGLGGALPVRLHSEIVAVASLAAVPTFTVLALLYVQTIGTGAPAVKAPGILGATPGAGAAAPNAGGTSIVFNAETTGTGTVVLVYLTQAAPASGILPTTDIAGKVAS